MPAYLSTDPNAGLGEYLSTDPNAGLEEKKDKYLSTDPNAGSQQAGEDYLKRVEASIKQQPRTELSAEEKARTGQVYAEPGEITGGKDQNNPFTGKAASESPLVSSDAIERTLLGDKAVDNPNRSPTDKAISKAILDRLSGLTSEKVISTLPMYAIPGYAEVQGLEGLSQSLPELKSGIKEGDPGKITGGSLDSIMGALMLGHRAIPRGTSATKDGVSKDLQSEKSEIAAQTPEQTTVTPEKPQTEPVGITETLAELKRRNGVTPGEVEIPVKPEKISGDGGFSDDPLVRFVIDDMGGVLSKSSAKSKMGELFQVDQYDDAPSFSDPRHNKVYNSKSGQPPDAVAQAAADAGLLPQGADASTLWQQLQKISNSAKSSLSQQRNQAVNVAKAETQHRSFSAAISRQEAGEKPINASNLQVGDTVEVAGESMKVTDIDPDNYDVTLEDGSKFGIQHVADNQIFYGEHKLGSVSRQGLETAGISQSRTEAELGEGSVEPGVGAELGSGLEYGRNFINKGGDPRLPIRRALTSGLVGKNEVGIVHAELERLRGERNQAAEAFEVNPNDLVAKSKLDAADAAQRAWRKELQPVLTKASDALREAYAESAIKPDVGTYQGLADLMDEHFGGKRDLTPDDRVKLTKAAKGVRDVRASTRSAVDRASAQIARRTRKVMTPDELRMDLTDVLKDAFRDCVV